MRAGFLEGKVATKNYRKVLTSATNQAGATQQTLFVLASRGHDLHDTQGQRIPQRGAALVGYRQALAGRVAVEAASSEWGPGGVSGRTWMAY